MSAQQPADEAAFILADGQMKRVPHLSGLDDSISLFEIKTLKTETSWCPIGVPGWDRLKEEGLCPTHSSPSPSFWLVLTRGSTCTPCTDTCRPLVSKGISIEGDKVWLVSMTRHENNMKMKVTCWRVGGQFYFKFFLIIAHPQDIPRIKYFSQLFSKCLICSC